MPLYYYLYDGSFPGLMTAIYQAYYYEHKPNYIISSNKYQPALFAEKVIIKTDMKKFDRVYQAVKKKISNRSLQKIYYAYLSELDDIEMKIYRYLRMGFTIGKKIDGHLSNKLVLKLNKIYNKVSGERHRLLGLLRFRKIAGDIYYAPFEPDHNVITLMAPHFAKRLVDQNWIIHDLKREKAVIYNQQEWVLTDLKKRLDQGRLTAEEIEYQELWRGFFDSVAIENRKNSRLQRQFMPERYWKYLIEKS
ncbi:DUF4130 domain-containing protein [Iocasia frigidifontis]|uniref:DUF4130 domain-containing protein n=1 Tax=Iocasia fonsfrigidae TaxID=2682810 RepID=A0A8A7KB57_9FIRM|nr:TIGR03915 family putative DNA repair protein [Iocasia fonsfrigidae]QTL99026.1 DUF4130 domain-containing protein [Iocasia fonsfrigidae]